MLKKTLKREFPPKEGQLAAEHLVLGISGSVKIKGDSILSTCLFSRGVPRDPQESNRDSFITLTGYEPGRRKSPKAFIPLDKDFVATLLVFPIRTPI